MKAITLTSEDLRGFLDADEQPTNEDLVKINNWYKIFCNNADVSEEEDYITANKRLSSALECLPHSCLPEEEKNNNIERLGKCLDLIRNEYKDKYKRELI
jgi:hypothetical protein